MPALRRTRRRNWQGWERADPMRINYGIAEPGVPADWIANGTRSKRLRREVEVWLIRWCIWKWHTD